MDNIEEKLKNLEEWNNERDKVKPFIDKAVESHNKARVEAQWKNFEQAAALYKNAIENYVSALNQKPKYYLQDLSDRIDHVIEEHVNNSFNLRVSGDNLKSKNGARGVSDFIDGLKPEERNYLNPYDIAQAFLKIADLYAEEGDIDDAYEFYNRVIEVDCGRPFIDREAYLSAGKILFQKARFKEALVSFAWVLRFDPKDEDAITRIDDCLKKLHIYEHREEFLKATPKEAKKLIMEVL